MEEQCLHTLAKEQIKNLRKFAGCSGEDVVRWLEDVEEVFNRAQIQPANKFIAIQSYLTDAALKWFRNNRQHITDWTTFKEQIVQLYKPSLDEQLSRLERRCQASDESLIEYYYDKLHLCSQVDAQMSTPILIHYLTKGLKPSLIPHVIRRNPTTKDEFLTVARDEERIEHALNGMQPASSHSAYDRFDYDGMEDHVVTLINRPTSSVSQRFPVSPHPPPPRPLMQSVRPFSSYRSHSSQQVAPAVFPVHSRRCYVCNRLGHLAKSCPHRKNM